ncbi:MAG TPA: hypothetical protein VFS40_09110, partial [Gemmatimonadales bacterium]|nr:hypothetical protein [Gemmatimonadales bacterium]
MRDDAPDRSPADRVDARPDSAMGGASDAGAHGRHPASTPGGSMPGHPIGDSIVERRHHTN